MIHAYGFARMNRAVSLYQRLPSALWPLAASFQAARLKRRRYGKLYRRALPGIRARLTWSVSQWQAFQHVQLLELMQYARREVAAYGQCPKSTAGARSDPTAFLRDWPLIDMEEFRRHSSDYVARTVRTRGLICLHTSGSSGTPKKIYRDDRAEQLHYAYTEARWRNTAGVRLGDRWVMIGGQLVVPVDRRKPPFAVAAYPMGQLYASSYHLQSDFAEAYLDALERWHPVYLWGYASSLDALAGFALKAGRRMRLKCAISNAEPLYAHVREKVSTAFDCGVKDTYGTTEGVVLGFECDHGRMHVSPDYGVLEILSEDGKQCRPGELGKVVATGLTNRAMPMIRYPIGDMAAWSEEQQCHCGCTFPILQKVEGRCDDLIELPDGRVVGRLDPVFKVGIPLREAQIIQKQDSSLELVLVPDVSSLCDGDVTAWRQKYEDQLLKELRDRVGTDLEIRTRYVTAIPRLANGKFRTVVRERL